MVGPDQSNEVAVTLILEAVDLVQRQGRLRVDLDIDRNTEEELLQNAAVKLWEKWDRFEFDGLLALARYLTRRATWDYKDVLRRPLLRTLDSQPELTELADLREDSSALCSLLRSLNSDMRRFVIAKWIDARPRRELKTLFKLSERRVKRLEEECLRALRQAAEDDPRLCDCRWDWFD